MSTLLNRLVRVLKAGAIAGVAVGAFRTLRRDNPAPPTGQAKWLPLTDPPTPEPRRGPVRFERPAAPSAEPTWITPVEGTCPASHPIKGNAASGIFHVPGGLSYDRTVPERCYATPADAEADGFRPAKR